MNQEKIVQQWEFNPDFCWQRWKFSKFSCINMHILKDFPFFDYMYFFSVWKSDTWAWVTGRGRGFRFKGVPSLISYRWPTCKVHVHSSLGLRI